MGELIFKSEGVRSAKQEAERSLATSQKQISSLFQRVKYRRFVL